jgi:hypothetical protein
MSTKLVDINKNEDFIFVDPVLPQEESSINESLLDKNATGKDSSRYDVPLELLHQSIDFKLRKQRTRPKFQVLQKWEGIVEEVKKDHILVKLIDLTNGGTDEEALLDYEDISADDLALVKEGAMFYWSIGYETQLDRQVKKSSFIKFRRLPNISPGKFDAIHERAEELKNKIILE